MEYFDQKLRLVGDSDRIFSQAGFPVPFEFNEKVAEVFDDMVNRSVPLYQEVARTILYWVHQYYQPGTSITDLGCSTGTTIELIARNMEQAIKFHGIDSSPHMISRAEKKLADYPNHTFEFSCQNLLNCSFENTSVAIMNYTLQFMSVSKRLGLLKKIKEGLSPGGIFILSEKIRFETPSVQETTTRIYEDFKRLQGYSDDEIASKKQALDRVLVPLTESEQRQMLLDAGFRSVEVVMKWNHFTTFIAI